MSLESVEKLRQMLTGKRQITGFKDGMEVAFGEEYVIPRANGTLDNLLVAVDAIEREVEAKCIAPPPVRCRDCRYASAKEAVISGKWSRGNCNNPRFRGSIHAPNVRWDGFCAWGERKAE